MLKITNAEINYAKINKYPQNRLLNMWAQARSKSVMRTGLVITEVGGMLAGRRGQGQDKMFSVHFFLFQLSLEIWQI